MQSRKRPTRELQWFFDRLLGVVAVAVGVALVLAGIRAGESFLVSALLGLAASVLVYVAAICSFVMWAIFVGLVLAKERRPLGRTMGKSTKPRESVANSTAHVG